MIRLAEDGVGGPFDNNLKPVAKSIPSLEGMNLSH